MGMDTNKRGPKKHDVTQSISTIWNQRLSECTHKAGLSRDAFVKAFKDRYGTGNRTDAYRWFNVGSQYKGRKIGLPTYDTMKHIADFFGVSVGYLTGETDFMTFDMGLACSYLGITESAGSAILDISSGNMSGRFLKKEHIAALCYLLSANSFKTFIHGLCEYAQAISDQKNPIDYLEKAFNGISPDIQKIAWELRDYKPTIGGDFPTTPTTELLDAIAAINTAIDKAYTQSTTLERNVKMSKYELSEVYYKLINEIVYDDLLGNLAPQTKAR